MKSHLVRLGVLKRRNVIVVCILLAGATTAVWWFLWVPNWRPPLRHDERYGIDVSSHQGWINWERVGDDNIDFVYIKATEGGDFVDNMFVTNWRGAHAADLDRGAYHFFTLCTPGAEQARNFLRVARPHPDALAPAVDLELAGNCSDRPPVGQVHRELETFLNAVDAAWGQETVLYVGDDWESRYPVSRYARPLWLRRFLVPPSVDDWVIWQLHGYARVSGIQGGVDLNLMRPSPRP